MSNQTTTARHPEWCDPRHCFRSHFGWLHAGAPMTWRIREGQITLCRFCADEPDAPDAPEAPEGPDYWPEVGIEITSDDDFAIALISDDHAGTPVVVREAVTQPLHEDGPAQLIEPGIGDIR